MTEADLHRALDVLEELVSRFESTNLAMPAERAVVNESDQGSFDQLFVCPLDALGEIEILGTGQVVSYEDRFRLPFGHLVFPRNVFRSLGDGRFMCVGDPDLIVTPVAWSGAPTAPEDVDVVCFRGKDGEHYGGNPYWGK